MVEGYLKVIRLLGCCVFMGLSSLSVGQGLNETAEERIARLKRELTEAEQAATLAAQQAAENPDPFSDVPIPGAEISNGALVIVETVDGGGGSGFVAKLKGRSFFVTNIHVLAAARGASFSTVNGKRLDLPNRAFLSRYRDLVIVPIEWTGDHLIVSPSLSFDEVAIGDAITVMGNSDAAGVATKLRGDIDGIGPNEIEISAKFVPGNSGSPIVHDALGTVIGIVSHMRDLSEKDKWTKDSELADIRRFGFRLDGEIQWQSISMEELFEQGEIYRRFEDRTEVLARTIHMLKNERTILTGYNTHDSLGYLFDRFDSGFSWKRGTASSHNIMKLERFVNGLQNEIVTDRKSTDRALTVDFFREMFRKTDSMRDYFSGELKRVRF